MLIEICAKTRRFLNRFRKDQAGVTAIEYAIVAVAISGAVALAFKGDGDDGLAQGLKNSIDTVVAEIGGTAGGTKPPKSP